MRQQLLQLAGAPAAGETTSGSDRPLKDATLLALYQRFPHYVRGPFRGHLAPSIKQPRTALLKRAVDQHDDELIDLLASHLAAYQPRSGDTALIDAAQLAANYYAGLALDDTSRAARAVRILKRVPAGTVQSLRQLERTNPLARALFARVRAASQASPETVAELLAAPDRQILSLGLDVLAQAGAGSALVVDANLDLLLDVLDRSVDRPAVRRVLKVLRAVATQSVGAARTATCAREARERQRAARSVGRAGRRPSAALPGPAHAGRAARRLPQEGRVSRRGPTHFQFAGARAPDLAAGMVDKPGTSRHKGIREGGCARNQPAGPRCFAGAAR